MFSFISVQYLFKTHCNHLHGHSPSIMYLQNIFFHPPMRYVAIHCLFHNFTYIAPSPSFLNFTSSPTRIRKRNTTIPHSPIRTSIPSQSQHHHLQSERHFVQEHRLCSPHETSFIHIVLTTEKKRIWVWNDKVAHTSGDTGDGSNGAQHRWR